MTSVRAVDVPLTSVDRWLIGLVLCLSLELTSVVTIIVTEQAPADDTVALLLLLF